MNWKINLFQFSQFSTSFRFFSSILVLAAFLLELQPLQASADEPQYRESVVGYGVNERTMSVSRNDGNSNKTTEEERCVFDPVFRRGAKIPEDYRGWSLSSKSAEKYPVPHLQSLKDYSVLDDKGGSTGIRYEHFEIVMNSYPNFFAGAPVPEKGCGIFLSLPQARVQKASVPVSMSIFSAMLEKQEPKLFLSAVCSAQAKDVMHPHFDPTLCERTKKNSNYLKNKSKVSQFYDGRDWYFVRSYQSPSALVLYRIDFKNEKLTPIPGFIGFGDGEKYLALGYALGVDLDGDGINEILVRQVGWEWSGFGYLKKDGETWK